MTKDAASTHRKAVKGQETRQRLVTAALSVFHAQGYRGTGLSQLVAESGFPRGSLYFHFPRGKEELAVAAITQAKDEIGAGIEAAFAAAADPAEALHLIADAFARELETSNYARGCPVTTVALEAGDDTPELQAVCAASYEDWLARVAAHLTAAGFAPDRAGRLAVLFF
jgi:TetR/AcrR family transcriptional repressor of lmrAB and yxaGH operons